MNLPSYQQQTRLYLGAASNYQKQLLYILNNPPTLYNNITLYIIQDWPRNMEKFLREWRQDALNKHQYESAVFVGDKLLALTSQSCGLDAAAGRKGDTHVCS